MAHLSILYFAWVREMIGLDEEAIDRPAPGVTVADLIEALSARSPAHAQAFADPAKLRAALDQRFVPLDTAINDAHELALFPPVTGG
jgi:molybdopterin synthase sulfur carrier subunit